MRVLGTVGQSQATQKHAPRAIETARPLPLETPASIAPAVISRKLLQPGERKNRYPPANAMVANSMTKASLVASMLIATSFGLSAVSANVSCWIRGATGSCRTAEYRMSNVSTPAAQLTLWAMRTSQESLSLGSAANAAATVAWYNLG